MIRRKQKRARKERKAGGVWGARQLGVEVQGKRRFIKVKRDRGTRERRVDRWGKKNCHYSGEDLKSSTKQKTKNAAFWGGSEGGREQSTVVS